MCLCGGALPISSTRTSHIKDYSECYTCINFITTALWVRHTFIFSIKRGGERGTERLSCPKSHRKSVVELRYESRLSGPSVFLFLIHYVYSLRLVKSQAGSIFYFGEREGWLFTFANSIFRYYFFIFWKLNNVFMPTIIDNNSNSVAIFYKMPSICQSHSFWLPFFFFWTKTPHKDLFCKAI